MKKSQRFWRGLFFLFMIVALCGGLALPAASFGNVPVRAAPQRQTVSHIVISQVYGGGGNSGAPYSNDYIELFNPSTAPILLDTWSIQYASANGSFGTDIVNLTGTLNPGQFYLVQLGGGTNGGSPLPAPDATGSFNMGANNGKVVLANITASLACNGTSTPCNVSNIIDLVGYGSANFFEGTDTAPMISSTTADLRISNGCTDTDDNNIDFVEGAPTPRNTAFAPLLTCSDANLTSTASAVNATNTSAALTSTANANATNTSAALTSTASAVNATATSVALTNTSAALTNIPVLGVVISEFRTTGPNGGNDEFIELYNPTTNWVDISGWKINASNSSGGVSTRATIPASTILRAGQYYLIANSSSNGYSGLVPANLTYNADFQDAGGIAVLRANNTIVDQVGMSLTSTYKEGTPLTPLSGTSNQSYERALGGTQDSCQDTNNNIGDFIHRTPSNPHNYSTISLCGAAEPGLISTTTTITAVNPNSSLVNGSVNISVSVTGSSLSPLGTIVNITGTSMTNVSCPIILDSSGAGTCTVKFTSLGAKTITATYLGDNRHASSSNSITHYVVVNTPTKFRTRTPTPLPPPPLVGINEFVPRPGHDWNHDGLVNTGDEYIELLNFGVINVNLQGYKLDDEVNIGSDPFSLPSVTLKPGERIVFYGSQTGLLLGDGGDAVRLLKPNGQLADAYNYSVVRFPDESYCRLPDNGGLDDWNEFCFPTPGLPNSLSESSVNPPTSDQESLCPISDTLPQDFTYAECSAFGNNIWNQHYWDRTGWLDEKNLPGSPGKSPLFAP